MKIYKEFYRYVLPSMLAFALSGVYAIADGFFVGNALGDNALAAINVAYPMTAFMQAAGTGLGMGGAVQYAIHRSSDNMENSRRFFGAASILLLGTGVFLTILFLLTGPSLLRVFGAEGEILRLGEEYIRFVSYGAVFQVLGTGIVPFIRNMDGTVTAMAAMCAGFVTNILLDYLFVWVFPYGMMGAAVATVVGQAVTFVVCGAFVLRTRNLPSFHFNGEFGAILRRILAIFISPFGLTFSPNITLILVNKSAAIYGGEWAITCYAAISYIVSVVLLLLQGVSDGSQPLVSLSYGQGRMDKARAVRNLGYQFALGVSLVCAVGIFLVRDQAAVLFGASAETARNVAEVLPAFLVGFPFAAVARVTVSYFYAAEKNLLAYLLIYGEPFLQLVFVLILPLPMGIWGTWLAVPLSQICMMVCSVIFVAKGRSGSKKPLKTP